MGQFANKEEAVGRLGGFAYDVNAVSIFGPYCDGIFVDREIDRWLSDRRLSIGPRYGIRAFSAEDFGKFDEFLDQVEEGETEAVRLGVAMFEGKC